MAVTPKEEEFAALVAGGAKHAVAYRQVYPHSQKWKDKTLWSRASELANKGEVQGRIKELREKAADANQITVERIVAELAKLAFGSARDTVRWGPNGVELLDSKEISDDAAAAVSEVSETVGQFGSSFKIKRHDKLGALKLLAEIKGFVVKKNEITGKEGAPLVPETKGVLVVPGVMSEEAWAKMTQGNS